MNAHVIQQMSQLLAPLFALSLIGCAVWKLRQSALLWIVCVAVVVALARQIAEVGQHTEILGRHFPSTHFAFVLAIAGAFWALNRRFIPATLVYLVAHGALMLWQHYHTPLELAGALYALPMGYMAGRFGTRRGIVASNT